MFFFCEIYRFHMLYYASHTQRTSKNIRTLQVHDVKQILGIYNYIFEKAKIILLIMLFICFIMILLIVIGIRFWLFY
jgi:hypothetical protein